MESIKGVLIGSKVLEQLIRNQMDTGCSGWLLKKGVAHGSTGSP